MNAAPHWFVAARSDQLVRGRPLARGILGRRLVLFRDTAGSPVALDDRCPHKNAPLSIGRLRGDRIVCRYHGWAFDRSGVCLDVPCHGPGERLPVCRTASHETREQDGWVWVWMGEPGASREPPPSHPREKGYRWFELHNVMAAPVDLILENGLDCSHTGFAHEGLFRSAPAGFARVRLEETPTGVRAETIEEPSATRDMRSLLGGRRRAVHHLDEIILPHTLRVDYRIGDDIHVITVMVATAEDARTTRVYTRMGVRYGRVTLPMTAVIAWLTRKVVAQDRAVLEAQARCIEAHGGREFRGVVADLPAAWLQRALRRMARGECPAETVPRVREIAYKL